MSKEKIKIGVIFGGKSGEHEVSLNSAKSIIDALDTQQYTIIPIGISKSGSWHVGKQAIKVLEDEQKMQKRVSSTANSKYINQQVGGLTPISVQPSSDIVPSSVVNDVDVIIPVLHGTYGEDGSIQGLLELMDVAYVGAGVLASAVGLDKIVMKQLFGAIQLPQVAYTYATRAHWRRNRNEIVHQVEKICGYPCFVKPANLGSSVGINKSKDRQELERAIELAFQFDRKVIMEQGLNVREIEVAVLGNDDPQVSVPGEILPSSEFYDYKAKYVGGTSGLVIPADVTQSQQEAIKEYAIRAFQAIDGSGLARVDFFIDRDSSEVIVNEINTMPGFTRFSMYPKLWEASGMSYGKLLENLVDLALERHREKEHLLRSYDTE